MKAVAVPPPEGAIRSTMARDFLRSMGPRAITTAASWCRLPPNDEMEEFDILILRALLSTVNRGYKNEHEF